MSTHQQRHRHPLPPGPGDGGSDRDRDVEGDGGGRRRERRTELGGVDRPDHPATPGGGDLPQRFLSALRGVERHDVDPHPSAGHGGPGLVQGRGADRVTTVAEQHDVAVPAGLPGGHDQAVVQGGLPARGQPRDPGGQRRPVGGRRGEHLGGVGEGDQTDPDT